MLKYFWKTFLKMESCKRKYLVIMKIIFNFVFPARENLKKL